MASSVGFIDKKGVTEVALGGILGFSFFWLTSHQRSPVHRKLPAKKYRNVHYLPHVKIERKDRHYHMHHWAIFGASYLPLIVLRRRIKSKWLHGFFIGSMVQGLTYRDRFKFVKPLSDFSPQLDLVPADEK